MIYNTILSRRIEKKKYGLHFPFLQSSSFHQRHHSHYVRTSEEMFFGEGWKWIKARFVRRIRLSPSFINPLPFPYLWRFNDRQKFETRKTLKRRDVNRKYLIKVLYRGTCVPSTCCADVWAQSLSRESRWSYGCHVKGSKDQPVPLSTVRQFSRTS